MSGQADWRIKLRRNPLPCSGRPHKTVRLPRWRRAASYAAQLVTRCRCLGMRWRRAALALNGTVGVRGSWEGPAPYPTRPPEASRADPCTTVAQGKTLYAGTYAIDPSPQPPHIDFRHDTGQAVGQTWQGVYWLEGRTLSICDNAADPAKPRPKELAAAAGSGHVLIVFRPWPPASGIPGAPPRVAGR